MRETTMVMLFSLCVGMYVCPSSCGAQECGNNPMKQVLSVAKRTGKTLNHVLTLLKDIDGPAYDTLAREFRMYAACVGLVDTGYFRKRSGGGPHVIYRLRKTEADVATAPSEDLERGLSSDGSVQNYNSLLRHLKATLSSIWPPETSAEAKMETKLSKRTGETHVHYLSKRNR